jgi:uncharacterized protein
MWWEAKVSKLVSALVSGMIFGLGIAISGMANPAKVQNFFDLAGSWDPSLAFVMGGALAVAAIGYRLVFAGFKTPLQAYEFHLPISKTLDKQLIGGAAFFGIGWGISGFCPGGAIPALSLGHGGVYVFSVSMVAGMVIAKHVRERNFADASDAI